ncbi:MAG: alpha-galactosidase [Clostridia bacterium]|nr:alpha-galactosidase [Clostridia bacterium]
MKNILNQRMASLWFDGEILELIPGKMKEVNGKYTLTCKGVEFSIQYEPFEEKAFYFSLSIQNHSDGNSPRIAEVNSFDCCFESRENPVLTSLTGDCCRDYSETQQSIGLPNGYIYSAQPTGGRSSNTTAFPYFNITDDERSRVFAIGWPGQWKTTILSNKDHYRVMVGIGNCDFYLKPNESVVFPSMLVLEGENLVDSRNEFRQLIIRHFSPKKPPEILRPISLYVGDCFRDEMNTEEFILNQIRSAEPYHFDVVWADAIWFKGKWDKGVGNYDYKDILPNGMKRISAEAHRQNKRFLQWFEIERAFPGTDMYQNHRDMTLFCMTRGEFNLVDLGDPKTCDFLIERLSGMIREQGIDVFRQDANIDMLIYWESNDEKGRVGMKQLQYIAGLYRLWDTLLERFPDLVIDMCASGGRRLDFETMRRGVCYCSSDYPNNGLDGDKIKFNTIHMSNLNLYVPNISSISSSDANAYFFRAGYNGAICVHRPERFTDHYTSHKAKMLIEEAKRLRPYYYGDFYQLTEEEADFYAYEFSLADRGFAMFLRHEKSEDPSLTVGLRGVDENRKYEVRVTNEELETTREIISGKALKEGYRVTLGETKTSMVLEYRQVKDETEE